MHASTSFNATVHSAYHLATPAGFSENLLWEQPTTKTRQCEMMHIKAYQAGTAAPEVVLATALMPMTMYTFTPAHTPIYIT